MSLSIHLQSTIIECAGQGVFPPLFVKQDGVIHTGVGGNKGIAQGRNQASQSRR
jgi:hypothetical protein